jgi:hypothetical protein
MKILLVAMFLCGASVSLPAQAPPGDAGWERVRHLQAGSHVHVAGDKQSKTCTLDLVDESTLRCSKGSSQYSFARDEVKSVKLTRYGRSTLVGLGIGLGVGAGVGAIAGHAQEKPNDFFPGLSTEAYAAIGGAAGLVAGGVIGRVTDFARGPTVYLRP